MSRRMTAASAATSPMRIWTEVDDAWSEPVATARFSVRVGVGVEDGPDAAFG